MIEMETDNDKKIITRREFISRSVPLIVAPAYAPLLRLYSSKEKKLLRKLDIPDFHRTMEAPKQLVTKVNKNGNGKITVLPKVLIELYGDMPRIVLASTVTPTPNPLEFPNTVIGDTSVLPLLLKANGSGITILSRSTSGAGFSVTGPTGPLASGASDDYTVTFAPIAAIPYSGKLNITSTATPSTTSIPLNGYGINSGHYTALSWTASPTTGIIGYNAFRGYISGGPYEQINDSPITTTNDGGLTFYYNDTNVEAGQMYFYVVTAVASDGITQSPYSNEASDTIPFP